ncbi:aspartate/glutamate racemase family protein [Chloroflexota bacterium]
MKIWCQLPVQLPMPDFAPFDKLVREHYELVKGPDTELEIRDVVTGLLPGSMSYLGLKQIQDREIMKSMLQAERQGYDAVAGACFTDSGILAARSLMDIPVVGAAESAMYLARLMGSSFAIITTNPQNLPGIEQQIREFEMQPFFLRNRPVRYLENRESFWPDLLGGAHAAIIEVFRDAAQKCIEDGADVLIVGCGALAPLLTLNGVREVDGVPIVDPVQSALKFAELMVSFRRSGMPVRSHRGIFLKAPKEYLESAYRMLGLD